MGYKRGESGKVGIDWHVNQDHQTDKRSCVANAWTVRQ